AAVRFNAIPTRTGYAHTAQPAICASLSEESSMAQTQPAPGSAPGKFPWVVILAVLGGSMATAEIISGSMLPLMATGLNTSEGMVGQAVTASAIMAILTSLSIGNITRDYD